MKFSLRSLFVLVILTGVVSAFLVEHYRPTQLTIGMSQQAVEGELDRLGAVDISDGMSVGTVVGYVPDENALVADSNMWHLPCVNVSIETSFENHELTELNVWDWTGRQIDRYHHVLEYDCVSSMRISNWQQKFTVKKIQTINRGVNPPIRISVTVNKKTLGCS